MTNEAIKALAEHGDLRVWSVLVSLFGDLATAPNARLSGACLMRLTGLMGIKPQAVRVALHRLGKDGWIVSKRTGRTSEYGLSAPAYAESLAAAQRIYARPAGEDHKTVTLVIENPGLRSSTAVAPSDIWRVAPGIRVLRQPPCPLPEGFLVIEGQTCVLPDWIRAALGPEETCHKYVELEKLLLVVHESVAAMHDISTDETAVLRSLIVHHWRRLLWRHADLPERFFPDEWRAGACRLLVLDLLDYWQKPIISDLNRHNRGYS